MGFREGAFATVWEITGRNEKYSKVRMTVSRKDKNSDDYITDFSGFVSLIGSANAKVGDIESALENGRCRIKLGACDVSNRYDKEEGREYVNYALFDFELADGKPSGGGESEKPDVKRAGKRASAKRPSGEKKKQSPPVDDEGDGENEDGDGDLPF